MPTADSSLEDAPEAATSDQPHDDAEPSATDKPSDGTVTQDDAVSTTPAADEPDPTILSELLGEPAEPKDEDPDEQKPPETEPQAEEQKSPEQAQPEATKPADDGKKALTPEEDKSTPKFARNRIKNLERQLEASTASVRELEARAMSVGYEKAEEVLEAVEIFGRALKKRDPEAIAALDKRLQEAGLKRPEPTQVGIPAARVKELLKTFAYDELERLANESEQPSPAQPKSTQDAPPKPPAQPEQAAHQPTQRSPEVLTAMGELNAIAAEIRSQHGEQAQDILTDIKAEMDRADAAARDETGAGLLPRTWGAKFRLYRDAVIARRRDQGKRTPVRALRSSTSTTTRSSGTSLTDELLSEA